MNIHYDFLKEEYLDEIARLDQVCFTIPWSKSLFASELSNPNAHYVLAFSDGTLAGYCGLQAVAGEGSITNIAVLPQFRGLGIASELLKKIINYANEQNLEFVTLEVRESNRIAIGLYRKFGFREVGKRKNYYSDNHETAILMTKFLS